MARISNKKPRPANTISSDGLKVLDELMAQYAAGQVHPMALEEAWQLFCDGKCEFASFGVGDQKRLGVVPVKGAAQFSAARRHKVKFKAIQEARRLLT